MVGNVLVDPRMPKGAFMISECWYHVEEAPVAKNEKSLIMLNRATAMDWNTSNVFKFVNSSKDWKSNISHPWKCQETKIITLQTSK